MTVLQKIIEEYRSLPSVINTVNVDAVIRLLQSQLPAEEQQIIDAFAGGQDYEQSSEQGIGRADDLETYIANLNK